MRKSILNLTGLKQQKFTVKNIKRKIKITKTRH